MKSKIITLAVAFVLGVTAIAFSVRPASAPSGKGNGKNTAVTKPEELVEIISSLPSAEEYYAMAQQANTEKRAKSVSAAVESVKSDIRSVSVCDSFSLETSKTNRVTYSSDRVNLYSSERNTGMKAYQDFTAYFTAEAVYYNTKATVISSETRSTRYFVDFGGNEQGDYERTVSTTSATIEAEVYLGVHGAFFKYHNYEIIQENVKYKNYEIVEEDKSEVESLVKKEAFDAIRKSYGKWINAFYTVDYDTDDPDLDDMDKDDMLDAMTQLICAQVSAELVDKFIDSTEQNLETLKKVAGIAALAGEKSNDYYDKSGKLYTMTPAGRFKMLSEFGYKPSQNELENITSGDGKINYNRLTPIEYSSFILDLSKGESPAWYLDFDFYTSNSNSDNYTSDNMSMHEDFYITNIDNTVVSDVNSSKNLYDFIGKQVLKVLKEEMEDR